jgi:MFS family permease
MLLIQIPYAIVLGFVVSIFPGYAVEAGLEPSEVGLLLSGFGLARTLAFSLAGRMQKFGERKSIGLGALGLVLVLLLMQVNRSLIALLADSCLIGAFIGLIYPPTVSYVSKHSPFENLGFVLGAYETIFGIGFTVGPILTGFIAEAVSTDLALLVLAAVAFSIIPMLAFARQETSNAEGPALKSQSIG